MAWHGRVHGDTETYIVQSVGDGENACVCYAFPRTSEFDEQTQRNG